MADRLKLLVYTPLSARMGAGGDRWLAEVLPRLIPYGFEITLMTTDFIPKQYRDSSTMSFVEIMREAGIRYQEIVTIMGGRFNHPIFGPTSFKRLRDAITHHDVTYFMNAYAFQDVFVRLAKETAGERPLIGAQHAGMFHDEYLHDLYMLTITRALLPGFSAYHVLNRRDLEIYRNWGLQNVFLIPNGVNIEKFSPSGNRETNAFTVLSVGRLSYEKGIDVLLDAVRILNDDPEIQQDNIVFRICGTGPLRSTVTRFAEETSNVQYLGYVTERELLQHYRKSNLFVMPSRRETFGLVAMEAMSSGLPVVTSDIPGPRLFVEESFGEKIPVGNPVKLAKAIKKIHQLWLQNPREYEKMGRLARQACEEKHSWDHVVGQIADMIRTVHEDNGDQELIA